MGDKSDESDNSEKSTKTFFGILKQMAEESSLHGVPKIVSSRQLPVKILWCMLFLSTFVVFVMQIYNLFVTFNAYPIQTSVSLEFSPLTFPAITLCNMNPIRRSKVNTSQTVKDIIYPKVKRKKAPTDTATTGARKKRDVEEKSNPEKRVPQKQTQPRPSSQTRKRVIKDSEIELTNDYDFMNDIFRAEEEERLYRIKRAGDSSSSIQPSSASDDSSSSSSSSSTSSSSSSSGSGTGSASGSSETGTGTESSYYYEYDYWGNFWADSSASSYSDDWTAWYSNYYSSSYGGYSGTGSSDDYSSTGYENYLYDQYFSPKDQWDERIVNFQTVFKNESSTTRMAMGHELEDVVVAATFVRTVQNITNFESFTTPEYGNCFTMTSPKYKAWRSGPGFGIKLTINLEVDEYIENFATGYGIRAVFHAPGTYPLASEEGLTLSPGYETSVGLRMVQISRLEEPYGVCSDGSSFYQQYGRRYSTAACMQFCRVRKAIDMCKCIPHDAPDIDFGASVNVCENSGADKLCTIQVDVKFDDGSYATECDCKSPCQEVIYEKTLSGRRWPNDDYLVNVLLENACNKNISSLNIACSFIKNNSFSYEMSEKYRNNFLRILIYFEDLNYESITQEPLYEPVRFLSDIGGAMGLFMGASILSFVEFLQLALEITLFCWRKYMMSQHVGPTSSGRERMRTPVSVIGVGDLNMKE